MQALKLIARALRIIRVLDADEAPESKAAEDALEVLNQMLIRWEADGISLGWSPLNDVSDELPLPQESLEAVAYNLASQLAIEYGVATDGKVEAMASNGYKALLRDVFASTDFTLKIGSVYSMWDIYSDGFGPRRY